MTLTNKERKIAGLPQISEGSKHSKVEIANKEIEDIRMAKSSGTPLEDKFNKLRKMLKVLDSISDASAKKAAELQIVSFLNKGRDFWEKIDKL